MLNLNRKKLRWLGIVAIISILNFGCKVYYETNSLDSKLKSSLENIQSNCSSVTSKIEELKTEFSKLPCKDGTTKINTANNLLSETEKLVNEMKTLQLKINDEYVYFTNYSLGKSKIISGTEEWKKFKITKKNINSNTKELQLKGEQAIKKATEFNQFINENISKEIQICDVSNYRQNFEKIILDFDKSLISYSENIIKYENELHQINERFSQKYPNECKSLLIDLEKIKSKKLPLEIIRSDLQKSIEKFNTNSNGKIKIYSCSKDWEIVNEVETEISAKQNELNNLEKSIQDIVNGVQVKINTLKP